MVFLCGDSSPNGRMTTAIFTWIVLNNSSEIRSNQQFGFQSKKFEKFPCLSMAVVSNLPVKTNGIKESRWIKVQECWRILGYQKWLGKIRVQTITLRFDPQSNCWLFQSNYSVVSKSSASRKSPSNFRFVADQNMKKLLSSQPFQLAMAIIFIPNFQQGQPSLIFVCGIPCSSNLQWFSMI